MKKLFFVTCAALMLFSCDDKDPIAADTFGAQPKVVGFSKAVSNAAYFTNVGAVSFPVAVRQVGYAGNGTLTQTPITISYSVDVANSTAVEGVEFNFTGASRNVVIQAGSSVVNIPLVVNTGSLNPTQKTVLVIKLTTTSDGVISEKDKKIKVVFVGCSTALNGDYNAFFVVGSVQTPTAGVVAISKIAPNEYSASRLPGFTSNYFWEFSDVCKDLQITTWQFPASNPLFKTGSTDQPSGVVQSPSGNLLFSGVNVTGVSFYVNRNFLLVKI